MKDEDPEWEYKDEKGEYRKWTKGRMERKENRLKFYTEINKVLKESHIALPDDNFLLRLGSYREWKDPAAVAKELRRMHIYRAENGLGSSDPMETRDVFRHAMIMQGHTHQGREVFYMRPRYIDTNKTGQGHIKALQFWANMQDTSSARRAYNIDDFQILVVDLEGVGIMDVSVSFITSLKEVQKLCYPAFVHQTLMINTGWVIEIVMNLINPWMPATARDKFIFFNDDTYKEHLASMIPLD